MPKTTIRGLPPDGTYAGPTPQRPDSKGFPIDYWVLPEAQRELRLRPLREVYRHLRCRRLTKIHLAIAETLASRPDFYGLLFCAECRDHYPRVEFIWRDSGDAVGS